MNIVNQIVSFITRPTRQSYHPTRLGPPTKTLYLTNPTGTKIPSQIHRQDCQIYNHKLQRIAYSFYHNQASPYQGLCFVYLHANNGSRVEGLYYLDYMLSCGLHVCLIDFSGSGVSEGLYVSLGPTEAEDLECVFKELNRVRNIDRLLLWGRSMGACTALMFAHKHRDQVEALILDSPFSSLRKLVKQAASQKTGIPQFFFQPILGFVDDQLQNRIGHRFQQYQMRKYLQIPSQTRYYDPNFNPNSRYIPALFLASQNDKLVKAYQVQSLYNAYPGIHNQTKMLHFIRNQHNEARGKDIIEKCIQFVNYVMATRNQNNTHKMQYIPQTINPPPNIYQTRNQSSIVKFDDYHQFKPTATHHKINLHNMYNNHSGPIYGHAHDMNMFNRNRSDTAVKVFRPEPVQQYKQVYRQRNEYFQAGYIRPIMQSYGRSMPEIPTSRYGQPVNSSIGLYNNMGEIGSGVTQGSQIRLQKPRFPNFISQMSQSYKIEPPDTPTTYLLPTGTSFSPKTNQNNTNININTNHNNNTNTFFPYENNIAVSNAYSINTNINTNTNTNENTNIIQSYGSRVGTTDWTGPEIQQIQVRGGRMVKSVNPVVNSASSIRNHINQNDNMHSDIQIYKTKSYQNLLQAPTIRKSANMYMSNSFNPTIPNLNLNFDGKFKSSGVGYPKPNDSNKNANTNTNSNANTNPNTKTRRSRINLSKLRNQLH